MGLYIPKHLMRKGVSKAAYSGDLNCPVCRSKSNRFVDMIGPYRIRYRCRKCGMFYQYETGRDMAIHPYSVFNKNKFRDLINRPQGRT